VITIKPLSQHGLAQDFLQTYKKIIKNQTFYSKTTPSRILSLRPSQMPFCALSVFTTHAKHGMYREEDFSMAFYTRVGTVVHEVMQNFLCMSGKLLADYHCRECGTWHRMSYKTECCDFPTQYHEVEIDYKGIKGHIDAIYKDRNGKLWIVDFKTTSLAGATKKKKDPGVTYKEQIEVYAVLVELQYGIKIEGYANSFILRDNPIKGDPPMWCTRLTPETRKRVLKRLNKYKRIHKHVLDVQTKAGALSLLDYGRCADPWCKVCTIKDDARLKQELLTAYKVGKANGHLPIRQMALNAEAKEKKSRSNSK
jgi:PD-(D/E)XK nuclease superfamily